MTNYQTQILRKIDRKPLQPYGLQVKTCKTLSRLGYCASQSTPGGLVYFTTEKGRYALDAIKAAEARQARQARQEEQADRNRLNA